MALPPSFFGGEPSEVKMSNTNFPTIPDDLVIRDSVFYDLRRRAITITDSDYAINLFINSSSFFNVSSTTSYGAIYVSVQGNIYIKQVCFNLCQASSSYQIGRLSSGNTKYNGMEMSTITNCIRNSASYTIHLQNGITDCIGINLSYCITTGSYMGLTLDPKWRISLNFSTFANNTGGQNCITINLGTNSNNEFNYIIYVSNQMNSNDHHNFCLSGQGNILMSNCNFQNNTGHLLYKLGGTSSFGRVTLVNCFIAHHSTTHVTTTHPSGFFLIHTNVGGNVHVNTIIITRGIITDIPQILHLNTWFCEAQYTNSLQIDPTENIPSPAQTMPNSPTECVFESQVEPQSMRLISSLGFLSILIT